MSNGRLRKCHLIGDCNKNGFKVGDHDDNTLSVFVNRIETGENKKTKRYVDEYDALSSDIENEYWKYYDTFSYERMWVAKLENIAFGESVNILLCVSKNKIYRYVYIGSHIIKFGLKKPIKSFHASITKHSILESYAMTENKFILFTSSRRNKNNESILVDEVNYETEKDLEEYNNLMKIYKTRKKYYGKNITSVRMLHENVSVIKRKTTEEDLIIR